MFHDQDAIAGETDQYFFKMYFWEHPELGSWSGEGSAERQDIIVDRYCTHYTRFI
jgi:hypothetical protein